MGKGRAKGGEESGARREKNPTSDLARSCGGVDMTFVYGEKKVKKAEKAKKMKKAEVADQKEKFALFTRQDSGFREMLSVSRIKKIEEQSDGTLIYDKYDVKTGEIYGHTVAETFDEVEQILSEFLTILKKE